MTNTRKVGIPATDDSFVELVEPKEDGFENVILQNDDGIAAFSMLYPAPKNNTGPARTPAVMMYAALASRRNRQTRAVSPMRLLSL